MFGITFNATTTLTEVGTYASALFPELLPLAYILVGFLIGGSVVAFIIHAIMKGAYKILPSKGGKRRRR